MNSETVCGPNRADAVEIVYECHFNLAPALFGDYFTHVFNVHTHKK